MNEVKRFMGYLDYETRCKCAQYILKKYIMVLDAQTKNYLLFIEAQNNILKDIQKKYEDPLGDSEYTPSEYNPSETSTESTTNLTDMEENELEDTIEKLKKQRKHITDKIYHLRKKHTYTDDKDVKNIADLFP